MNKFKSDRYNTYYEDFDLLVKYKGYVTGQGTMYQAAVHEFLSYIEAKKVDEMKIDRDLMVHYYNHLLTRPKRYGGNLSKNTIKHHLFAIRIFFDMLIDMEILDAVPYLPKFTRGESTEPDILDQYEIKELYDLCENSLERAFLSASYGCALRRSELEALNLDDFVHQESYLIVRQGKNSKRREVPLSEKVKIDLYNYTRYSRPKVVSATKTSSRSLFINEFGNRITGQAHYRMLRRLIDRSENDDMREKQISLHSLRRSIATHLTENGADMYFVKSFLGHVKIDTSQLYAIRKRKRMAV
jgi:integrase/recombinase XerD